jgi:hypothetical protein
MTDSRTGAANIQGKSEASCSAKKVRKCPQTKNKFTLHWWSRVTVTQESTERAPKLEQSDDQKKVLLSYNLKYKVNINHSIMT